MVIHCDWSLLPSELLERIADHIIFISDFIRFRSACKSWRSAALPNKLRPQPPIVLLAYNILNPNRYIFSLATRRVHHLYLPQLVGKRIITSTNGWMLLVDFETNALSLLNPVTSAHVQLPPTNSFEGPVTTGYLFHDMLTDNLVVVTHDNNIEERMVFCKVGDESWSVLESNLTEGYWAITYYKGLFFASNDDLLYTHDPRLAYCDQSVPAGSLRDIPGYTADCSIYFVTCKGELLLVCNPEENPEEGISFYKLDYDGKKIKLSKVEVEDHAMINSGDHSFMFCVKDFPHYKENFVYSSWRVDRLRRKDQHKPTVGILHWKDGTTDLMKCGWMKPKDFNEMPVWITLSF